MWRPKGWDVDKLYLDFVNMVKSKPTTEWDKSLMEAGADAMLWAIDGCELHATSEEVVRDKCGHQICMRTLCLEDRS